MTDVGGDVQRAGSGVIHRDIPDEVVKRAQLYDYEHFREDRAGERGGSWGSVPPDQVRRLLWGAYGQPDVGAEDIREREHVNHDLRCDRDLCHPDCPIREQRIGNDQPYPGSAQRHV